MLAALVLGPALALLASQDLAPEAGASLARFEASLRPHPYLGRIAYTRVDDFAPFHFFVKRPDADEPGYYGRVAGHYGPWFRELERLFVTQYVEPLGLERRPGHDLYAVFVLDSSGAYKDYADAARTTGLYAARAHYDAKLGAAVTYENAYQPESRSQHRRAAMHELVHALQHAYFPNAERLPEVVWFNEGLADYLSYCEGLMPPALAERKPDVEALELVAALAQAPAALASGLLPLEELAALRDYAAAEDQVRARGGGVELAIAGQGIAIPLLYAQSSLWTYFLHHGEQGRHRAAYLRYASAVWRGESGAAPLRTAFEGTDLAELDRTFRLWLKATIAERLRVTVGIPLDPGRAAASPGAESVATPVAAVSAAPFVPAELLPDLADAEIGFALALEEARSGALTAAEERLDALARSAEPLRARCEHERERMRAFRELRRRFFAHLAQPGARKLDTEVGGQKVLAQVTAVEGERVRFGANKRGLETLALDQFPNLLVAELARDKKYAFEAGPALAWAYALEGDERWRKLVPAGDPLEADARDYAERRALGRAADALVRLSAGGEPADLAACTALLAEIGRLLRESDGLALVATKRPALRALARTALARQFEQGGLRATLQGALEELGGGRVRLTYGFDTPAELADFTQTDYLSSQSLERKRQDFTVQGGSLVANGYACLRSRLAFQGEQHLRCRARYAPPEGSYDPRYAFLLGLNDDGLVSFAASDFGGALRVLDLPKNYVKQTQGGGQTLLGEAYTLELAFDGTTVSARVNGQARGSLAAGPRQSGAVFLLTSADFALQVEELVIEGTLTPESLALFRDEWSTARLAELGL